MATDASTATKTNLNLAKTVGLILSIAGILNAGYLTWTHYGNAKPALCTEGGGCDIVQNSVYATISDVPIALLGLLAYVAVFLGLLLDDALGDLAPALVLGIATIGTLYSVYLTYLELFVLFAICPYCVASALFMVGLLGVAIYRFRQTWLESPG